jgi:hypothetical protein
VAKRSKEDVTNEPRGHYVLLKRTCPVDQEDVSN